MKSPALLILLPGILLSGCTIITPYVPETGHYYINPDADFTEIGKVAILEPVNHSVYPDLSEQLARMTCQALQKKHLFNAYTVDRNDPAWAELDLGREGFDLERMQQIRRRIGADALVLGRITDYQPYPHLLVGMNLKMLDLRNGRLVWGVEQLWDSDDKGVQQRMKGYYCTRVGNGYAPLGWEMMMTSPKAFHRFVAWEVAQTLPQANQILRLRPATTLAPAGSKQYPNIQRIHPIQRKMLPLPAKPLKLRPVDATIAMEQPPGR